MDDHNQRILSAIRGSNGRLFQILALVSDGPTRLKLLNTIYSDLCVIVSHTTSIPTIQRNELLMKLKDAHLELKEAEDTYAATLAPFDGHVYVGEFLHNLSAAETILRSVSFLSRGATFDSAYFDSIASLKLDRDEKGDVNVTMDSKAITKAAKFSVGDRV